MEPNQILSGFRLVEERPVPETDSLGRLFIHEKSGARLLQLENRDPNKVFGIGFRTPSEGSTGVAHILEHSVLKGAFHGSPALEPVHLPQRHDLLR